MHVNVYVAHLCVLSIAYRLIEGAFLLKGLEFPPVEHVQSF